MSLYKAGFTPSKIAKKFNKSINTIKSVIRRFQNQNSFQSLPRSGRPPKPGPRELKWLEEYIRKHPQATPQEIANNAQVQVQWRQIYRLRKKLGFVADTGAKKICLTPEQKKTKVDWCKKHLNKSWENVIFADEKPFIVGKTWRKFYHKKTV